MNGNLTVLLIALVADGNSDRVLLPIIRWAIRELDSNVVFADAHFRHRSSEPVSVAIDRVTKEYRPHLVFVHRDAERASLAERKQEIPKVTGVVPIVPVRMTEAWLLANEVAIRRASGNPNGRIALDLPSIGKIESIPDPKGELHRVLRLASELKGRRLRRLDESAAVHRVAENTEDFRTLRGLAAFVDFESELAVAYRLAMSKLQGSAIVV